MEEYDFPTEEERNFYEAIQRAVAILNNVDDKAALLSSFGGTISLDRDHPWMAFLQSLQKDTERQIAEFGAIAMERNVEDEFIIWDSKILFEAIPLCESLAHANIFILGLVAGREMMIKQQRGEEDGV